MRLSLRKDLTETFVQKWAFKYHRKVSNGVWSCPITAFQMNQRQGLVIIFWGRGLRLFGGKETRTKSNDSSIWITKWETALAHHRDWNKQALSLFSYFSNKSRKYAKGFYFRELKECPLPLHCIWLLFRGQSKKPRVFVVFLVLPEC